MLQEKKKQIKAFSRTSVRIISLGIQSLRGENPLVLNYFMGLMQG